MIETDALWADFDRYAHKPQLDAICDALTKADMADRGGPQILANRIIALAALRLYQEWQREVVE